MPTRNDANGGDSPVDMPTFQYQFVYSDRPGHLFPMMVACDEKASIGSFSFKSVGCIGAFDKAVENLRVREIASPMSGVPDR